MRDVSNERRQDDYSALYRREKAEAAKHKFRVSKGYENGVTALVAFHEHAAEAYGVLARGPSSGGVTAIVQYARNSANSYAKAGNLAAAKNLNSEADRLEQEVAGHSSRN